MKNMVLRFGIVCFFINMITGCSTPSSVLHLASQGTAITGKIESELDSFVNQSNLVYEQRLDSLKRLATGNIQAYAQMDFENYTVERANMSEQAEMIALIRDLSDHRARTRDSALKQQAEIEKTLKTGEPTNIPKEKFSDMMKAFTVLSEELTPKEWLNFSLNYGKQVNDSVKKLKAAAAEAKNKADEGQNKLQQ